MAGLLHAVRHPRLTEASPLLRVRVVRLPGSAPARGGHRRRLDRGSSPGARAAGPIGSHFLQHRMPSRDGEVLRGRSSRSRRASDGPRGVEEGMRHFTTSCGGGLRLPERLVAGGRHGHGGNRSRAHGGVTITPPACIRPSSRAPYARLGWPTSWNASRSRQSSASSGELRIRAARPSSVTGMVILQTVLDLARRRLVHGQRIGPFSTASVWTKRRAEVPSSDKVCYHRGRCSFSAGLSHMWAWRNWYTQET